MDEVDDSRIRTATTSGRGLGSAVEFTMMETIQAVWNACGSEATRNLTITLPDDLYRALLDYHARERVWRPGLDMDDVEAFRLATDFGEIEFKSRPDL